MNIWRRRQWHSCNKILTVCPSADGVKMKLSELALASSKERRQHKKKKQQPLPNKKQKKKKKISSWPLTIPSLHHLSLRYPSFSPWSCLHGNPLPASHPWASARLVYVCVSERVWAGRLIRGTKLEGPFLSPCLPPVNLSQSPWGRSGRGGDDCWWRIE